MPIRFNRSSSTQSIKNSIFGFRSGVLFTNSDSPKENPYIRVYLYVSHLESGECNACFIGSIVKGENKFYPRLFNMIDLEILWEKDKRLLEDDQIKIVRDKLLKQPASYTQKIKSVTGVFPTFLKESMGFQRGLSDKEIRDTVFGWREGRLLICPHTDIVYVFLGMRSLYEAECFSIGHLGRKITNKNPKGKIGFRIYRKRGKDYLEHNSKLKDHLRSLTDEEKEIIKPSLTLEYINKLGEHLNTTIIL